MIENNTKKFIHLSGRNEYNTPYMRTSKCGVVQRFVYNDRNDSHQEFKQTKIKK